MRASELKQVDGGLRLPLRATMAGRVKWRVLDDRGNPEVPRDPSGFALAPAGGVEQSNLITNLGLDAVTTSDALRVNADASSWRAYLAVGTGSAAPANGDTALAAEAQRAASSGAFSAGSNLFELDATNNVWRATSVVTRLVTMTTDRNLTEFGLSNAASIDVSIRELLRDGGGTPITVSLLNGKTLRVDHTLTVELPAPAAGLTATIDIDEYDVGDALVSSTPYGIIHGGARYLSGNLAEIFDVWNPYSATSTNARRITASWTYDRVAASNNIEPNSSNTGFGVSTEAYTPGTHERTQRALIATGSGNGAWYGFMFAGSGGGNFSENRTGWSVRFDDPATYTKVDTDTLQLGLVSSWARA